MHINKSYHPYHQKVVLYPTFMMASETNFNSVQAKIKYVVPPKDAILYAYSEFDTPPPGKPFTNTVWDFRDVTINDARGHESEFSLDIHGFEFMKHTSSVTDFQSDHTIRRHYYPEIKQFLKEKTGANRVIIISHIVR